MFHTARPEDILEGKVTDVYFQRTLRILKEKGVNPVVKAEFIAKGFPESWPWAVFAGLEEVVYLLRRLPVKLRAMREGSVFYPFEPVMEIEGHYQDFCIFETAILGLICQASGVAAKAARFKGIADGRLVVSFGARRMHPIIAPMIERNAYIGGCDGVAVVKSGEIIGEDPMGTMPHALIICMGSTVEALKAYDEVLEPRFRRVALIDTFLDEKFEALNVAETLGDRLFAVRLDTPSSRRGNFYRILEEVRWELDLRGYGNVKLFVSGGIKESDIMELNPVVDAYGIGTSISNAPVVDYAMDIMEVSGRPLAKRGKRSGSKRVLRCNDCGRRMVVPFSSEDLKCRCGGGYEDMLVPVLDNGNELFDREPPNRIRGRVLRQIEGLPLS
ncbi:nicotinate phosphoribosyltransferase pncB2 [bacterium BMS3Bbin06]|nr:nicotinate phosphoribosyltransferase pncB2 [bacterium BMS3Bbin06]HDO35696.1 nicotinate phosphoribosyltransferase [Nitrospirota bacterium]